MARGTPSPRAAVSRQTLAFKRSLGLNRYAENSTVVWRITKNSRSTVSDLLSKNS
jgi:hypothetical protein